MDGQTPTAFRAREREDLIPTFKQLQRTQPDLSLKWWERNRIWSGPGDARDALAEARARKRPSGHKSDWRPGGDHRDPHQRYEMTRDQKRARFKTRQRQPVDPSRGPRPSGPRRPIKPPRD